MRMLQPWSCDKCGRSGSVPFEEHDDFMTVFYAMDDAHKKKSPDCVIGFPNHVRLGYGYPDPNSLSQTVKKEEC